ncbi:MAG: hypothetical protein GXP36_15460 [Actinobacteria bacterium]|nr:hypothetical protein [Actinomycetota bacterium]
MKVRPSNVDGEASFDELARQPLGLVRCLKCGVEAWFQTPADAHEASWDVAPYFVLQPLCPDCLFGPWVREFVS